MDPLNTLSKKHVEDSYMDLVGKSKQLKIIANMKYVIFPDNFWVKCWDILNVVLLTMLIFIIPYQVGVTAGYYVVMVDWWFAINVIIDTIFLIDTFLYFWRAYEDKNGRVIFNLPTIRKRYLRNYFIPNLLSNVPVNILLYAYINSMYGGQQQKWYKSNNVDVVLIKTLDVLKFLRFLRLRPIIKQSTVIRDVRQRFPSQVLQLGHYLFLMLGVAHWFACIWSFTAFIQVRDFSPEDLCNIPNWLGNWYQGNYGSCDYVPGTLYPLGWTNDLSRYVLSLFWSIQTITSIGYGNISPYTPAEWWVSSFLMLLSGFLWAYTIGGLVNIAEAYNEKEKIHGQRVDQANEMISHFIEECTDKKDILSYKAITERNIKKYLHDQKKMSNVLSCACDVGDVFPVYESLPPHLQGMSSLMLFKNDIDSVPYLSSKYLSWEEQMAIAMKCKVFEFGAGEVLNLENLNFGGLDRGIFVMRRGMAWGFDYYSKIHFKSVLVTGGNSAKSSHKNRVFGHFKVLVDDGTPRAKARLEFLTFSKLTFIPREAVLETFKNNPTAWKECARWMYLRTMLMSVFGTKRQIFSKKRLAGATSRANVIRSSVIEYRQSHSKDAQDNTPRTLISDDDISPMEMELPTRNRELA